MNLLYNFFIILVSFFLRLCSLWNSKLRLFVRGRKQTLSKIRAGIQEGDQVVWFHCASLGEFEQGRPLIEGLKRKWPEKRIVVSFFSPSGYEIRKDYDQADVVCYLPLDTRSSVNTFLDVLQPEIAVFVKYEIWPNLIQELNRRGVRTILFSGIFRSDQIFFKPWGGFMRKLLFMFDHLFVQDDRSKELLEGIGLDQVTKSGDTRFDRVAEITNSDNSLDFVESFRNGKYLTVAGSTWPDDEALLTRYINNASSGQKFIIAPHNITEKEIQRLLSGFKVKAIRYSSMNTEKMDEVTVLVIDTIGLLTKIYSYADVAYVGGGFTKSGVHNVLEPATFGVPVVIGPNFKKFREVKELVELKGCFSINEIDKLSVILDRFFNEETHREFHGKLASQYVSSNTGATATIINYLI